MDRLDGEFAIYWDGLRAELATHLPELTLSLFRDLPSVQATTIARHVENGKKLRAGLLLTVCEALGGSIARALPSAATIECVHAASLIHDDLVDGDRTRRGRPATWVLHGSRQFGSRVGEAYQIADDLHDVLGAPRGESPPPDRVGSHASLLASFGGSSERSAGADRAGAQSPESFLPDAERIAAAMEKEIGRRIELARQALAPLPAGPRLAFLHRAPRAIVDPVIMAAARSRADELAAGLPAR